MIRFAVFPVLPSLFAFILGATASIAVGLLDAERLASEARNKVIIELALVRARIEGSLKATFNSTDGLVHLISLRGGIDGPLFSEMARLAIGKNPHVRNITVAPDDIVRHVYPLLGNEKVLGFAFASRPEQMRTVQLARERREPLLAGPVELVQGGRALIQRTPVFVREASGERYWGAVSIVAYIDGLLQPEGAALPTSLQVAIRGRDGLGAAGAMVDGDPEVFSLDPVLMDVSVPGGSWQVAALPVAGWESRRFYASPYFQGGILVSLLLALIIGLRSRHLQLFAERNVALELQIRERERAEASLRDEEERFRVLFELSPDPAWIIEGNEFVAWNEAARQVFGITSATATIHPAQLSPACQPDGEPSLPKAERLIAEARRCGVVRFEWVHLRADGQPFTAEVTLLAVNMREQQIVYAEGRDISERKRAEQELQASRNLLQALVESAGAVIYVFDPQARLLLCNQQFEEALGQPRQQMLGKRRHEFMPAEVAAQHEGNDQAVIASRKRASFEEVNLEADGLHHYLTIKCPVFSDGAIRGVVGISTDITERKRDEEQLKLAAAILASTSEGVIITDVVGVIVAVNRAFSEITGYSEAEALGQKPNMLRSERQPPDFYRAMWAAINESGSWQGEIWNRRKCGEAYPEWLSISAIRDHQQQVTHYVGVFSDISSLKLSQERLEHLAHFDPLTDLPNRVLFQDRLAHAIDRAARYQHGIAVLLLDLDGFKHINDSLGHPVGDQLLTQVAARLSHCVRVEDTVARLGGDEFAVILVNMRDASDAIEVVRKILLNIEQPFDLDGTGAMVSASIGIAVYPADGGSATELVRNADAAMYGAKEAGRNTYCFYQSGMTHRAQERLRLEAALKRAIEGKEFEVWYQPQISLHDGRVTGAEALLRWRDPEHGLVSPAEFIPLAERTGLILPIGELVVAEVAEQARAWRDAGLEFGRLAINVATPQLERSDFPGLLQRTLAAAGVPPEVLEIEITESFIMSNAATARESLLAIQALGVTTAVDDFGTGYSSLAYLKDLPIDSLKIDRAFVCDLPGSSHDAAINRAIIAMAHSLGFKVIAEGIENADQQAWLAAEGCDEAQGYAIARPLPAAEFADWLRRRSVRGGPGAAQVPM